jgi:hypothetical protein
MKFYHYFSYLLMVLLTLILGLSAGLLYAYDLFSIEELNTLSEMLATQGLNLRHSEFYRDWDPSTQAKNSWHMDVLQKGIGAEAHIADLRELMAEKDWDVMLSHFAGIAWEEQLLAKTAKPLDFKNPKALFRYVESSFSRIQKDLETALAQLSDPEADSLAAFLLLAMTESEDAESYRDYLASRQLPYLEEIDIKQFIPLLQKVDFAHLGAATLAMSQLYHQISQYRPKIKNTTIYQSKYGLMIMGSSTDDRYTPATFKALTDTPVCLLIEPDGDDIYEFSLATSRDHPFYLHIDHSGDDLYRSQEPAFFAFGGIGLSADRSGNDIYQLADFCFAAVLGTQLHIDASGDDVYVGGLFAQGAAIAGLSLLIDQGGNDSYRAHAMAQAFASTCAAGILADYDGADTYYLGGKYYHAPLMPDDYRTMGQGMGFGLRPHLAGGLGFLYDKAGNDKYLGGIYAQGVGYWYATGILIDEGGNDIYNAIYYPQGSGIHLASGILYDHEGNDAYYSRHGPGQGAGHDWGFGMLIDAAGNDAYSIEGGNGLGLTNSLGIFLDKQGNDRYERNNPQNYGNANLARSTGGIGLFLDAGGEDSYPDTLKANNSEWTKGKYGFGRDLELNAAHPQEDQATQAQDPAPAADADIAEIFAAAAEWEVGSAVQRVRTARQILIDRAPESTAYILEHKLANTSGLEYRALEAFTKANADFPDLLLDFVSDSDSLKAKTAISLLADVKDLRLLPYLEQHLNAGRYLATCLSVLGYLDDPHSLWLLQRHQNQDNERLRFLVVRALSRHKSEAAKTALESFTDDESFLIQALIRNLPKEQP